MKKLKSIPGVQQHKVKKTVLKGLQTHIERRLYPNGPQGGSVGQLEGVPGMHEELFEAFAGPLPDRRKHLLKMNGIVDNTYPEEQIPLRNPKKSEPMVSVAVQKMIFPPDWDKPHDGEKIIRNDEAWAPHFPSCMIHDCVFLCDPHMDSYICILYTYSQQNSNATLRSMGAPSTGNH